MASSYTKTIQTALLALQSVASNTVAISSELALATNLALVVSLHFGRRTSSALTAGVNLRVEAAATASGNGHWFPVAQWLTNKAVAAGIEAVSGTCAAGQKVIAMASTTGFALGDIIYIDNGTIANSEWARVAALSANVSVTIEDNLLFAQTSSTVYNAAQLFLAQIDAAAITRLRIVVDASNTGQAIAVEAEVTTCDSIG